VGILRQFVRKIYLVLNGFQPFTGWNTSYLKVFLKTGERPSNLIHAFNIKQGLTIRDFELSYRFLKEPPPDGVSKGAIVHIQPMLRKYFNLRDWEWDTGKPSREKLLELELDAIAVDLCP
jgi:aldehyde:ferredoxin oxidoreductase